MTLTHDFIGQLREDWRWQGRHEDSISACARLRDRHPNLALRDAFDLFDVVVALDTSSGRSVLERAHIVQALLIESDLDIVRRALLQTLLPGVISVCRQLHFGGGIVDQPHDVVETAISLLSELIVDWAGQSRPYAGPDLLSALRGRLRRWLMKEKQSRPRTENLDAVESVVVEASPLLSRLETLRDGPHERLARLTYDCVFAGVGLRALARADHSSVPTLKQELQIFALTYLLG